MSTRRDMHRSAFIKATGGTVDYAGARRVEKALRADWLATCGNCMFYDANPAVTGSGECFRYPGERQGMLANRVCGEFAMDAGEFFDIKAPEPDDGEA